MSSGPEAASAAASPAEVLTWTAPSGVPATGYTVEFPFLDKALLGNDDTLLPLYRRVVPPDLRGLHEFCVLPVRVQHDLQVGAFDVLHRIIMHAPVTAHRMDRDDVRMMEHPQGTPGPFD